jgi:hypothetical protein
MTPTPLELEEYASTFKSPYKQDPLYSAEEVKRQMDEDPNLFVDSFKGVLGGAERAVRSVFQLADPILPDQIDPWKRAGVKQFTPETETFVGGLLGGFTQFAVGFGAVGLAGKGVLTVASKFNGATTALKWAAVVPNQVKNLSAAGKTTQAVLLNAMYQGGIKGPIADFIAFADDEERLSDWIETTKYSNGLTELLATKETDSGFESRLKNVAEGFILGGVLSAGIDTITRTLRRSVKIRAAVESGEPLEDALSRVNAEIPEPAVQPQMRAVDNGDGTFRLEDNPDAPPPGVAPDGAQKGNPDATGEPPKADEGVDPAAETAEASAKRRGNKAIDEEVERVAKQLSEMADSADGEKRLFDFANGQRAYADTNMNQRYRTMTRAELDALEASKGYPNMRFFEDDPDSVIRLLHTMVKMQHVLPDPSNPTMYEARTRAMDSLRRVLKGGPGQVMRLIAGMKDAPAQIHAIGKLMQVGEAVAMGATQRIRPALDDAIWRLENGTIPDVEVRELLAKVRSVPKLLEGVRNIASSLGFNLNLRNHSIPLDKIPVDDPFKWSALEETDFLTQAGTTATNKAKVIANLKEMKSVLGSNQPLAAMASLKAWQEAGPLTKGMQIGREYYINAILSNPASWAVNSGSGLMMGATLPAERMAGAFIGKQVAKLHGSKNVAKFQQAILRESRTMRRFYTGMAEAIEIMRRNGEAGYVKGGKLEDFDNFSAIQQATRGRGEVVEFAGKALTFPSYVMGKGDAVIKIAAYRSRARALLEETALAKGVPASNTSEWVEEQLELLTTNRAQIQEAAAIQNLLPGVIADGAPDIAAELGKRIDLEASHIKELLDIHDQSIKFGEEITFSTRDGDGFFQKTGNYVSRWIADYPLFSFLLPFVRTPANIAQFTWDRTFGLALEVGALGWNKVNGMTGVSASTNALNKLSRELMDPNISVRVNAAGRLASGIVFATALTTAAVVTSDSNGFPLITGGGSEDKEERRAMIEAGWQPYSIRIGDKYVSYSRFDPYAGLLGIVADYAAIQAEMATDPTKDDQVFTGIGVAIVGALAKNLASKTYLAGLSSIVEAASGDTRSIEAAFGGSLGAFFPAIASNQVGALDPELREIRSVLDRIKSRIPGLSSSLPPRRNLLGEPVKRESATGLTMIDGMLPVRVNRIKDDIIAQEVAQLAYGFNIPGLVQRGVDLTDPKYDSNGQGAYDRYMELSGEVRIGGKDLRQALRILIGNSEYQRLSPEMDELGQTSPRVALINSTLAKYRKKAWTQLLKERPDLRADVKHSSDLRKRPTLFN